MNFRQKITLSLFVYIVLGSVAFAQVVDIPDPNLRAAVLNHLSLPPGTLLTQDLMRDLTRLTVDNLEISNLSGLEFATNVLILEIRNNYLTDIQPLATLTDLVRLELQGNRIHNIHPLADLTQLETLLLMGNTIEDLTPLSNLKLLTELNLRSNPLSDLSPLSNLTSLKFLDLGLCRIEEVRPLANLTTLKVLQLNDNRIVDPSPLKNLVELAELEIQTNSIFDHSALDALQLDIFIYDEACDLPPLSPHARITDRSRPSVFTPWSGPDWPSIRNRPDLSGVEKPLNTICGSAPRVRSSGCITCRHPPDSHWQVT